MPEHEAPALETQDAAVTVPLSRDLLERLDLWIAGQESAVDRAEALRRLAEMRLDHVGVSSRREKSSRGAEEAVGMASNMIDSLGDCSATRDDREQRKRRLVKGPFEFREIRKKHDDARRKKSPNTD